MFGHSLKLTSFLRLPCGGSTMVLRKSDDVESDASLRHAAEVVQKEHPLVFAYVVNSEIDGGCELVFEFHVGKKLKQSAIRVARGKVIPNVCFALGITLFAVASMLVLLKKYIY